jgi:flagellar protein FliS
MPYSPATLLPPAPVEATGVTAAADRYLVERVGTASPAELTAMLFDSCVGAIKGAVRLMEAGEHQGARPKLLKAQDIVLHLRTTLNHDAGELAASLEALYTFVWTQLVQANVQRDSSAATEALKVMEPLQQAWRSSCLAPQPV